MREILFKGKRLDDGEWIEGSLVVSANNKIAYILPYVSDVSFSTSYGDNGNRLRIGCFGEVDPATVGQFTGLTLSCNMRTGEVSKKAFEGDIIGVYSIKRDGVDEYIRDKLIAVAEIFWDDSVLCWNLCWHEGDYDVINEQCDTRLDEEFDWSLVAFANHMDEAFGEFDIIGNIHGQ